jgi:hypothetical protein
MDHSFAVMIFSLELLILYNNIKAFRWKVAILGRTASGKSSPPKARK